MLFRPCLFCLQVFPTDSRVSRTGCGWSSVPFFCPDLQWAAIRHPCRGSVRCRGNRGITSPSCCRRVGCYWNYGPCGAPSIRAGFCRKNHGRNSHRPTAGFSTLVPGILFFSWSSSSRQLLYSLYPIFQGIEVVVYFVIF